MYKFAYFICADPLRHSHPPCWPLQGEIEKCSNAKKTMLFVAIEIGFCSS